MPPSALSRIASGRAVLGVLAVAFGAAAVARAARPVTDQDSFWIAAAGRRIWETGHAPRDNAFSFTEPSHPWIFHELGFGVLYAKGLAWLGPAFLDVFGVVAGAATFGLVVFVVSRSTQKPLTLALVGLPCLAEVPLFHPRPPFASLGLVAAMTALAFAPRFGRLHAALAIAVEWAWALCHGSFPLGVLILLVAAARSSRPGEEAVRRGALAATAAGAAAVTILNPYGPALYGLVAHYLFGDDDVVGVVHQHITEFLPIWRAPSAFGPFDAPALAIVTGVAAACLYRRRDVAAALLVLVFAGLGALEVRNVQIALVLGAMLLAPEVEAWAPGGDAPAPSRPSRAALWVTLPGVAASIAVASVLGVLRAREAWLGDNVGGRELPTLLARIPDGARVYAPFGVSPAVIWYGSPRGLRVLYDARNDCYSPGLALAALRLEYDAAAAAAAPATLLGYGTEYALARTGEGLARALAGSGSFRRVEAQGGLELYAATRDQ